MKAFPLQDVIDDLLNTDKSLSSPLLKLHYLGKLIGNQELIDYTHREINGYIDSEKVDIPPYRKTPSTLHIEMQAHMHIHHATLPISMIEKEIRNELEFVYIREGIASIEKMAGQSIENDGDLVRQLPLECLFAFQEPARKLYKSDVRLDVISAKLVGNSNVLVEIPNSIRGKLLDFVFLMAETFGYNIEIESFKSQINSNQTIINHMNTIINNTGDGNILNTGNKANIDAHTHITKNNKDELVKHLREIGITEHDTAELIQIIDEDQPDYERKTFGKGVNAWIAKMFNKAIDGSWNIGIGAAGGVLAEAIGKYFGF